MYFKTLLIVFLVGSVKCSHNSTHESISETDKEHLTHQHAPNLSSGENINFNVSLHNENNQNNTEEISNKNNSIQFQFLNENDRNSSVELPVVSINASMDINPDTGTPLVRDFHNLTTEHVTIPFAFETTKSDDSSDIATILNDSNGFNKTKENMTSNEENLSVVNDTVTSNLNSMPTTTIIDISEKYDFKNISDKLTSTESSIKELNETYFNTTTTAMKHNDFTSADLHEQNMTTIFMKINDNDTRLSTETTTSQNPSRQETVFTMPTTESLTSEYVTTQESVSNIIDINFNEKTSAATSTIDTSDNNNQESSTFPTTITNEKKPRFTTSDKLACPGTKDSMYPDPNDPKYFIICFGKQKFVFHEKCPYDGCYNPNKLTCEKSFCENKTKLECPGKFSGIYKDSSDCSRYVMCDRVKDELFARHVYCINGYHYNPLKKTCEAKELAGCEKFEINQNVTCPENVDGWHADPNNCSYYYVCEHTQTKVSKMPCPDGLHYRKEWQSCDYPQNAGCIKIPDIPEIQHFHDPCPNKQNGFFPDPYNCMHYYECTNMDNDNSKVKLLTCSVGYHFSPITHACDLIEKASCIAQPLPIQPLPIS